MADRAYLERLSRDLTDQGKLIEAGWIALRIATLPANASANQLHDMRIAFFSGAQHLWGSIFAILSEGIEPTKKDEHRMELIDTELAEFVEQMKLELTKTKGSS